jgi:riboflavin synthase alpha subunit
MFTGLVECLGTVRSMTLAGTGRDLLVAAPFAAEVTVGDSVAINGCCLTVVERSAEACRRPDRLRGLFPCSPGFILGS